MDPPVSTTVPERADRAASPDSARARRPQQLRRLLAMVGEHRGRFWLATVALLLGSGLGLVYPQAAKIAVDRGVSEGSPEALDRIALLMILAFVAQGGLTWLRHYLMSWLGERVVADLRRRVFERLLTLPPGWFHERRTGELVGRLASDVTVVEGIVGSELSIALRNAVTLVGGLVLLFVSNWRLTLAMLLIVPPLAVGAVAFGRRIRRMSKAVQDRLAEASAQVDESIGAIETVQAFTREALEVERYRGGVEAAFEQSLSLARWRATFMSTVSVAGLLAVAGLVWLGGREVIGGRLTAGDLAAFLLYTLMVTGSLGSLAGLWGSLQRAAGATERLFDIVDTAPEIRDPEHPVPLPQGPGAVRFEGVSFRYPTRPDHPVLRDVSLEVAAGQTVALVGSSGAGKSTLTALLLRFWDVDAGRVQLEGVDVRALRLAELRRAMAIVAQEPVLMSGTIRENIAYGDPSATAEAIERAARDAHAHDFITAFPDGFDTVVGERGVKLSGGQKQRIAIARALLADPRVLILDEATSNLDAESERLVQAALQRLMHGRTTLVIAHRLSTVRDADRIVVLDRGRVVEEGGHDALMARDGAYRRLVEHQLVAEPAAGGEAAEARPSATVGPAATTA
jgi:ABC transporter fused permease/ATP-binding protein